jgi:hypothetical protein
MKRIEVQNQPGQRVHETLLWKSPLSPSQKKAGGVAQDVGPEFRPQHCKKKKKSRRHQGCRDVHTEKSPIGRYWGTVAICKVWREASGGKDPADFLVLDIQPPEPDSLAASQADIVHCSLSWLWKN